MVLHVVRATAELVRSPYVVVFLASGMPPDAGPTFDFLRLLLEARALPRLTRLTRLTILAMLAMAGLPMTTLSVATLLEATARGCLHRCA